MSINPEETALQVDMNLEIVSNALYVIEQSPGKAGPATLESAKIALDKLVQLTRSRAIL